MTGLIASIPSPPLNALRLGPFQLRFYGLMIALGVIAAARFADRRWVKRGWVEGAVGRLAIWAVPAGVLGARLYHVITDYELYTNHPWKAFAIWDGGLGIPGGIAAGMMCGLVIARRRGLSLPALLGLDRSGVAAGSGDWTVGELVQPGAVRPAIHPALGGSHRSRAAAGRTREVCFVPTNVSLRVRLEPLPSSAWCCSLNAGVGCARAAF